MSRSARAGQEAPSGDAPDRRRVRAERRGRWAEAYVAARLRLAGWRILARRVRTPFGEIDGIARRGRTLAFLEIKARADWHAAETAITPHQRQRIARAAE
ncbi:MAG: YraN family protein, partial [Pseudomonadota bacterium]